MIRLPDPKPDVLARRDAVIAGLRAAVADPEGVIADPISLKPYETDGLSAYRQMPLAVALPGQRPQSPSRPAPESRSRPSFTTRSPHVRP